MLLRTAECLGCRTPTAVEKRGQGRGSGVGKGGAGDGAGAQSLQGAAKGRKPPKVNVVREPQGRSVYVH